MGKSCSQDLRFEREEEGKSSVLSTFYPSSLAPLQALCGIPLKSYLTALEMQHCYMIFLWYLWHDLRLPKQRWSWQFRFELCLHQLSDAVIPIRVCSVAPSLPHTSKPILNSLVIETNDFAQT